MTRFIRFFMALIVSLFCISCGLEKYISLKIPTATWTVAEKACSFYLVANEDEFTNYIIYYKLYYSSVDMGAETFSSSDFDEINTTMYSNYAKLYSYTTADEASTGIETLFTTTLGFQELVLGEPVLANGDLDTVTEVATDPLADDNNNLYKIDFNITTSSTYAHPCLINQTTDPDTYYRLLRYNDSSVKPSRDFLQTSSMAGDDMSGDDDDDYTYVMMYLVAKGIDTSFASIYSQPEFLGVFQLP